LRLSESVLVTIYIKGSVAGAVIDPTLNVINGIIEFWWIGNSQDAADMIISGTANSYSTSFILTVIDNTQDITCAITLGSLPTGITTGDFMVTRIH